MEFFAQGAVYYGASQLVARGFRVDDPLDAIVSVFFVVGFLNVDDCTSSSLYLRVCV
jgi:hypothetical protein